MHEAIVLGIGQAGTQLSNALWELLCLEHGITSDGRLYSSADSGESVNSEAFFLHTKTGKRVPHAVIVDLEPTVIDPGPCELKETDPWWPSSRDEFNINDKFISEYLGRLQ